MNGPTPDSWKQIQERRNEIDRLDSELLRLLSRRACVSLDVANIKKSSGLPLYDAQREQQVIERLCLQNSGPLGEESISSIFRCVMEESRRAAEKGHPQKDRIPLQEKREIQW
ncbi:MAG TPA: chorismate mutase [Candidatus Saccharimonadales bacterium]|jgi:chorismate mutase|nr:chorismate mutase [Candidatus Saccharimonadales bacterium]